VTACSPAHPRARQRCLRPIGGTRSHELSN
jgi:hypothetical protein